MDERWHGTIGGYTNHDCRCDKCRSAWNEYMRGYFARIRSAPLPSYVIHGTCNAYCNYGCRCQPCKDASAAEARENYRARKRGAS